MKRAPFWILLLVLLQATGCIIGHGHEYAHDGDVYFTWSFQGANCRQAGIQSVQIDIPGERLENDGLYACLEGGYPGIVLHSFAPGTYDYTVYGYGYGGELLYASSSSFTIDGDVSVDIDLQVSAPYSYAYLIWRFPPFGGASSPTCSQAGVARVFVSIDGGSSDEYSCEEGFSDSGAPTRLLEAGNHSLNILATDAADHPLYRFDGTLTTFAGQPSVQQFTLREVL